MFADESSRIYLPPQYHPSAQDVICARGKKAFTHLGNQRYREIVAMNIGAYTSAECKNGKSSIVWTIVEQVRSGMNGDFVKFCLRKQLWYRIGDVASSKYV